MGWFKHKIEKITQNYTLKKHLHYRRYVQKLSGRPPLIIYQMGKVGSTSLLISLKERNLPFELFHVHVLEHQWINQVHSQYRHASRVHGKALVRSHVLESMYLRSLLDRDFKNINWNIITLVRDPVARNISAFFQALPIYLPELFQEQQASNLSIENRVLSLHTSFQEEFKEHDTPLTWFETHLEPVFGIDVYQSSFPKDLGYQIIRENNVNILLLRLENLDTVAENAFKEFLEIENFAVNNLNVGEQKSYSDFYERFKKQFQPSSDYIDRMYNSRYMHHFYTPLEISNFRERWIKPIKI